MKQQKKSKGIIFFISILLASIIISSLLNNTVSGSSNTPNKSYITVTISINDTLWDIANQYMNDNYYALDEYIDEVIMINSIQDTTIYAGEQLTLPIVK